VPTRLPTAIAIDIEQQGASMPEPMRIRASMAAGKVEVRVLMSHEMETGMRKGPGGKVIPAHFIQHVSVTHNGRTVMGAEWGPAVSRNPYLHFRFSGGQPGEKIAVTWIDSKGEKRTDEAIIAPA
jgi:sulfur-oxidizing protein SoxZ